MAQTIEELLKSMLTIPKQGEKSDFLRGMVNSKEVWEKIGNGSWSEGMSFGSEDEKAKFLADFIENNPYSNIA